MKNIKLAVSLFVLVCVSACGKEGVSTALNSSGNTVGSCVVNGASGRFCTEFSQPGSVTSAGKKAAESVCAKVSSKFEEKGCDIDLGTGYCSYSESAQHSGEFITLDQVMVFHSSYPTTTARSVCNRMAGGRYSTTAPVK